VAGCSQISAPRVVVTGPPPPPADRPIEVPQEGFTTSSACRSCHPAEYESWHASFHHTMTQEADASTVVPAWEGELTYGDERFVLERRGDELWVELNDPDFVPSPEFDAPSRVWRQIVLSTGSHNFQAYWFPSGVTRKLYLFTMCYRIDAQCWLPIDAAFIEPPSTHRKPRLPRWNIACLKCHTTKPIPAIDDRESMDTMVTEFGISCEACHGPGEEHVAANQNPLRRYGLHFAGDEARDETIYNPLHVDPERASDVCGQCHTVAGVRSEPDFNAHGFAFEPGGELFADRFLVTEGENFFWEDGRLRVAGREYNSLIRSPCYLKGEGERRMTCLSCHEMHPDAGDERPLEEWRRHQLKPEMRGNASCTQCHPAYASPEALQAHTHHGPESGGSSCLNCHMPRTSWGLLMAIRSHEISSPSVQESLRYGRPNACNLCHLDQPLAWTADHLSEWYGKREPGLSPQQGLFAASVQWILKGDAGLRALMAWHMGWPEAQAACGTDWMAPYLATLLDDPYKALRFRASRTLRSLPGFEDLQIDIIGPEAQLHEARRWVDERWKARGPYPENPALLIHAGGLYEPEFQRLLGLRDQKVMFLAE